MTKKKKRYRAVCLVASLAAVGAASAAALPAYAAENPAVVPQTYLMQSQTAAGKGTSAATVTEDQTAAFTLSRSTLFFGEPGVQETFIVKAAQSTAVSVAAADSSVAQVQQGEWDAQIGGFVCTVTAKAAGQTVLTVTSGAEKQEIAVTVQTRAVGDAVSVALDTTAPYTFQGIGKQYKVLIQTAPNVVPQCASTDTSVMTASQPVWSAAQNGYLCTLTSAGEGEAALTVQAGGTKKVLQTSVVIPPVKVWSDTASYQFYSPGQSYTLLLRTTPQTKPTVAVSDAAVVTAAEPVWNASVGGYLCQLTAGGEGSASVTVTAGKTVKTIPVQVAYKPVMITRDTYSYTFRTVGQQYTMFVATATNVRPQVLSSNEKIVKVTNMVWDAKRKGYFCTMQAAENAGKATVSITAGSTTVTVPVTVTLNAETVHLDTSSYQFHYRNQSYQMLAQFSAGAVPVVTVSNPAAVSLQVRSAGADTYLYVLTAKANGEADVLVRAGSTEAKMHASVDFQPISIRSDPASCSFTAVGQSRVVTFYTSYNLAPQFSTSNSYVAAVQNLGWNASVQGYQCRVTATGEGSAAVTAKIAGATSKNVSVSVVYPVQSLMLQRAQRYSSRTGYLLLVDTKDHRVGVYTGRQSHWKQLYSWQCADGAAGTPTVKGEFAVQARGYYFDSGAVRCFYYTQFHNGYLFHSVLYQQTPTPTALADGRVGVALSHGCVRLQLANAKWINQHIPTNTKVVIY
ncbi:L,D-transpeptidase [Caproicibacterium argilliputei]|uniref:L,D-transpeptidase n=1 Tax=Caproicibacterium sp. XB1 TaxID=3396405 RepID=UPI0023DC855E